MNFGCYSFNQYENKIFLSNNKKNRQFVTSKEVWNSFIEHLTSEAKIDNPTEKLSNDTWIRYSRFMDIDYVGIFRENGWGKMDFSQGLNFEKDVLLNALPLLNSSDIAE